MKKAKRKLDKLTEAVVRYKRRHNNQLMRFIQKESERLIYSVMKFYSMNYFPKLIQEEVIGDCKTFVLLKAIRTFNRKKNTKFSTYYVWKLKSHVHCRHLFYLRRKRIVEHLSLSQTFNDEGASLENKLTISDTGYKEKVSRRIRNLFGV